MTESTLTSKTILTEQLAKLQTDTQVCRNQEAQKDEVAQGKRPKKRIGPYSYHLNDIVGSGFSSTVFKGFKQNDKQNPVAIKVVHVRNLKSHRRALLQNEINILRKLDHPNILSFKEVYYTVNNCYIITQFCEGGSLENLLASEPDFDWRKAAYEISIGCQYLSRQKVIHRDLKPSNIMLKSGVFKICDFGFACQFTGNQKITQDYLIGSPLYMPPESLCDFTYSSKSDSFALGVALFHMISKHYPWKGKSKRELIYNYEHKKISKKKLINCPPRVKHLIFSLCELKCEKRVSILDCDIEVFMHMGPPRNIKHQLTAIKHCYSQQIKLCQYINSVLIHYYQLSWANTYLEEFIVRHLNSLTFAFEWHTHPALSSVKKGYCLSDSDPGFGSDDYFWLNNCLKDTIRVLSVERQSFARVMLEKLLYYQSVVEAFLFESPQEILDRIRGLVIHQAFDLVRPNEVFIGRMKGGLDFYEL